MPTKKSNKVKSAGFMKIKFLSAKNLNLDILKINPINIVEGTKNKIGNYYINFKN